MLCCSTKQQQQQQKKVHISTFTYGYCCWMTWLIRGRRLPRSGHGCLKLMAFIKAIGDTAASLCRSKIIISKSREPFSISFFLALFLPSVSNYGVALLTLMLKSYSLLPEKTKWSPLMIQGTNHFKCVIKFANCGLVVRSFDVSHNSWPDVYFLWHWSRLTLEPGVRGVFLNDNEPCRSQPKALLGSFFSLCEGSQAGKIKSSAVLSQDLTRPCWMTTGLAAFIGSLTGLVSMYGGFTALASSPLNGGARA